MSEIAEGLHYLHSRNVIHGDLKGVCCYPGSYSAAELTPRQMNVLVDVADGTPRARIADLGIATVTRNPNSIRPVTGQNIHSPAWSAPEVMRGENPTKESDIYSFAMIVIEVQCGLFCVWLPLTVSTRAQVLSGDVPFSDLKTNWMVLVAVLEGKRPPRPAHPSCTHDFWTLIQRCWDQVPQLRPDISRVLQTLSSVSAN